MSELKERLTIAELAALPMPELERKFRETQGFYSWNEIGGRYGNDEGWIIFNKAGIAASHVYETEVDAWSECTSISNDEWLETLDGLDIVNVSYIFNLMASPPLRHNLPPHSERLKSLVLAAYIYTNQ